MVGLATAWLALAVALLLAPPRGGLLREAVRLLPDTLQLLNDQFENLERASRRLLVVVPLALLLIFVLLFGTFGAPRPALLIFLNVPFAATGGVLALALRGMPFSISSGVGFIACSASP